MILDRYPYNSLTVQQDHGKVFKRDKKAFQIIAKDTRLGRVLFHPPRAVVFAFDSVLGGWPLENGKAFVKGQHLKPEWLITADNPNIREMVAGQDLGWARSPGHPVFYSLDHPGDLRVFKTRNGNDWKVLYNGQLIQKIKSLSDEDFLSLTLAADSGSGVTGASSYLVLPYATDQWVLRSGQDHRFPFYLGPENGVGIRLKPALKQQVFLPEKDMAPQLMAESLGQYSGIYFRDGLKRWNDLSQQLAEEPLTRVERKGLSWEGNGLNNVIRVTAYDGDEAGITASGRAGDDFIQVAREIQVEPTEKGFGGVNWAALAFMNGLQVEVDGGEGKDLIDLSEPVAVKVQGSPGQDTILISRYSLADLSLLRDGVLLIRGLSSAEVEPVFAVSREEGRYRRVSDQDRATHIFLTDKSRNNGRYRFIARISPQSIQRIHFADGFYLEDVTGWLSGRSVLKEYRPAVVSTQASTEVPQTTGVTEDVTIASVTMEESTSEPLEAPGEEKTTVASDLPELVTTETQEESAVPDDLLKKVDDTLQSAHSYAMSTKGYGGEDFQQSLNRLVQEMAGFTARRDQSMTTPSSMVSSGFGLTTPLAASSINTTTVFSNPKMSLKEA